MVAESPIGSAAFDDAVAGFQRGNVPPPRPANDAASVGDGRVRLSWAASLGTEFYRLKRGTSPGAHPTEFATTGPATAFEDTLAIQSLINSGLHQLYFFYAADTLPISTGDTLFAYVYLDPANPPETVCLQFVTDDPDFYHHRAYWGADYIPWGDNGTETRWYMGDLPPLGQWVRLEVPASVVGITGDTLGGWAFTLFGGRATWDRAGKVSAFPRLPVPAGFTATEGAAVELEWQPVAGATGYKLKRGRSRGVYTESILLPETMFLDDSVEVGQTYYYVVESVNGDNHSGNSVEVNVTIPEITDFVWVDDESNLPAGAVLVGTEGDPWTWVTSNPTPFSGAQAHQSILSPFMHQHYFYGATQTMPVNPGDSLFAYIYLDPANPPGTVMLQWFADGANDWVRAYWGADNLWWGVNGTPSRWRVGDLPAAGGWVRLEVPASVVALEDKVVSGLAFTLYGGRATWDQAGKRAPASASPP